MRTRQDPPETFRAALCGFGCGEKWEHWCKGCNLVYCDAHVGMKTHKCKRMDLERGLPGLFGPVEKSKKAPKPKPVPAVSTADKPISPPLQENPQLPLAGMSKEETHG